MTKSKLRERLVAAVAAKRFKREDIKYSTTTILERIKYKSFFNISQTN